MLAKLTRPDMKVEILEILSGKGKSRPGRSADSVHSSPRKPRGWGAADDKLVMARCRLLIGLSASSSGAAPGGEADTEADGGGEEEDDEVHGLVAFSLHLHPTATAAAASTAAGAPPVLPPATSKHSTEKRPAGGCSLFLPSNPHDLRFLREGVEVWVWAPYEEVVLDAGKVEEGNEAGLGDGMDVDGGAGGASGGSEGRETVALVCSRFGVLV